MHWSCLFERLRNLGERLVPCGVCPVVCDGIPGATPLGEAPPPPQRGRARNGRWKPGAARRAPDTEPGGALQGPRGMQSGVGDPIGLRHARSALGRPGCARARPPKPRAGRWHAHSASLQGDRGTALHCHRLDRYRCFPRSGPVAAPVTPPTAKPRQISHGGPEPPSIPGQLVRFRMPPRIAVLATGRVEAQRHVHRSAPRYAFGPVPAVGPSETPPSRPGLPHSRRTHLE